MPKRFLLFKSEKYYQCELDAKFTSDKKEDNYIVKFLPATKIVLADYYQKKYAATITISRDLNFALNIGRHLANLRIKPGDFRHGFSFGTAHSIPVIYIKENSQEAILIACSQGKTYYLEDMKDSLKKLKIAIYAVSEARQSDDVSCHLDSLIFCKIATEKAAAGIYQIPNLLAQLKARGIKQNGYFSTKLPEAFLVTTQLSNFYRLHKQDEQSIVHHHKGQPETLPFFRKRYEVTVERKDDLEKNKKMIAGFNRRKAIKVANLLEINFYWEQLKNMESVQHIISPGIRTDFFNRAKKFLADQGAPIAERKGLQDFAEQFYDEMKMKFSRHQIKETASKLASQDEETDFMAEELEDTNDLLSPISYLKMKRSQ